MLLGLVSGYFGGWLDRTLVVVADAVYAFPSLLLAIVMAIVISGGQSSLVGGILAAAISITVVFIPQYFRVIRAETVRIKAEPFVESARVIGRRPPADHGPARAAQRHPHAAADLHAQRLGGDPDPGRPGLPRLRHPADRRPRSGAST